MKFTKYFLSMAAAVGMIAGCQKTEMVQISAPEDVVAPVLNAVEDINITAANLGLESVTFEWSAADFGVKTQVNYAIEVASAGSADKVVVTSGVTGTSAVVPYESLNAILLYDLGLASGIAENVDFYVSAKVGEYAKVYSAPVTASATVTEAEKEYPKLTVAGSYAYNNWTPGKGQFVFDFDGTDDKYSGIIDFGEDVSSLNFKFVGSKWGENEFSVPSGETQAPEAAELPLVAGGGDNIAAYATHRYYSLTLVKSAPKVIKNFSFNSLGVIGDATATGWDSDTDMEFNPEKQRFYVDMTLADGTIKFRANDAWDVNWGGANGVLASGGDNIAVEAGNYRIYVNLNDPANLTYELNAKMFGQEEITGGTDTPEPPVDEPDPVKGWGLIGNFNGWGGDLMLTSDGTYYVIKGAELEGELKFRKDADWAVNFGLAEGGEFAADAELALAQDGANINVAAGTYDVYLDEANAKAWFITDGSYPGGGAAPEASEWGVVGQVNGWGATPDIVMYKTATEGLFVARNVEMPDGGFKIRANNEWNDAANYGLESAGAVEVDHAYDLICGGGSGDMTLVAGTYDIWFDLTNSKIYIMTPGKDISEAEGGEVVAPEPEQPEVSEWYLVGNFNGWTAADENYKLTAEGDWFVFKNFTADGQGVKFVADANWTVNRGGTFVAAGEAIAVEHNGSDMMVAAGTYDVYLSKDGSTAYFMTPGEVPALPLDDTWYLVGNFNGWTAADENYKLTAENGWYVFKNFTADGQGVKFVADANWTVNRGGTFVAAGEAIAVEHNGSDMMIAAGTYDVYLNASADTAYFMEVGQTPAE